MPQVVAPAPWSWPGGSKEGGGDARPGRPGAVPVGATISSFGWRPGAALQGPCLGPCPQTPLVPALFYDGLCHWTPVASSGGAFASEARVGGPRDQGAVGTLGCGNSCTSRSTGIASGTASASGTPGLALTCSALLGALPSGADSDGDSGSGQGVQASHPASLAADGAIFLFAPGRTSWVDTIRGNLEHDLPVPLPLAPGPRLFPGSPPRADCAGAASWCHSHPETAHYASELQGCRGVDGVPGKRARLSGA